MLTKSTFRTILFMAVLLLIIPMIMSAEESITFDSEVMGLLEQVEARTLTMERANERIISMGEEYSVNAKKMEQVQKMMDDLANGDRTIENCLEQLKTQEQNRVQVRTQTPNDTPLNQKTQTSENSGAGKN